MNESFYTVPGVPYLALLSDLHDRDFRPVVASLERRRPELICVTGDLIMGRPPTDDESPLRTQANPLALLAACAALTPTFVSLGNHEWMLDHRDLEDLSATGARLLDNAWVEHAGINLGGLTSGQVMRHRRRLADTPPGERGGRRYPGDVPRGPLASRDDSDPQCRPNCGWLAEFASHPGYHILLSHHPEYHRLVPAEVELTLSGHAHGGQWRIFGHGVYAPGQGLWPRLTRGVYGGRLVVSAGLANTAFVPRLLNPVEVVYVRG